MVDGDGVAELLDDIDETNVDLRQARTPEGTGSLEAGRKAAWLGDQGRPDRQTSSACDPGRPRIGVAATRCQECEVAHRTAHALLRNSCG